MSRLITRHPSADITGGVCLSTFGVSGPAVAGFRRRALVEYVSLCRPIRAFPRTASPPVNFRMPREQSQSHNFSRLRHTQKRSRDLRERHIQAPIRCRFSHISQVWCTLSGSAAFSRGRGGREGRAPGRVGGAIARGVDLGGPPCRVLSCDVGFSHKI